MKPQSFIKYQLHICILLIIHAETSVVSKKKKKCWRLMKHFAGRIKLAALPPLVLHEVFSKSEHPETVSQSPLRQSQNALRILDFLITVGPFFSFLFFLRPIKWYFSISNYRLASPKRAIDSLCNSQGLSCGSGWEWFESTLNWNVWKGKEQRHWVEWWSLQYLCTVQRAAFVCGQISDVYVIKYFELGLKMC